MESKHRTIVASVAVICLGIAWLFFSGSYGETSDRAYDHAMALISACNLKDVERVQRIQSTIAADEESQTLAAKEARWLNGIIDQALKGEWETASRQVRKLMNAQVKRAQQ